VSAVTFLDHTADVGMDVEAADLPSLFHEAALGMVALLRGREDTRLTVGAPVPPATPIELEADGGAALMAAWLRELLFLHESRGRDYVSSDFDALEGDALRGRVHTEPVHDTVREIKGVTYHELSVRRAGNRWRARVIFDV
jgi:SHS2 domain-containing protein